MVAEMETVEILAETKAAKVLDGYLLPSDTNTGDQCRFLELNNIYTSVISDTQASSNALAVAGLLRYSTSQAYCFLSETGSNLNHKLLRVQAAQSLWAKSDCPHHHTGFQVVEVRDSSHDVMEPMPLYMIHKRHKARPALDQAIDAAMEQALGMTNLELNKNVTIDLIESEDVSCWRDRLGFCVSDRHDFIELKFRASHLSPILAQLDSTKYQVTTDYQHEHLEEYDKKITNTTRAEYLHFLTKLPGSASRMAYAMDGSPSGVSLAFDTNILTIYAETDVCAAQLLDDLLKCYGDKVVTMNAIKGGFIHRLFLDNQVAHSKRHVKRLHTTAPPKIQWQNVFALNIGMHVL